MIEGFEGERIVSLVCGGVGLVPMRSTQRNNPLPEATYVKY